MAASFTRRTIHILKTASLLSDNVSPKSQAQVSEDLSAQASVLNHAVAANSPSGTDSSPERGASHFHPTPQGSRHASNHGYSQTHTLEGRADSRSEGVSVSVDGRRNATEDPCNHGKARPHFEPTATRSIQLSNLADETTHADIAAAVRGGLLLDIFLRRKDGTTSVSFLSAESALAFYEHGRKNDLYISNRRLGIKWNERQYVLPGHLAQKVGAGVTRNFVIRRCDPNHTEASIREDLEHIHNLIVVKMNFLSGDCYISTNSVANAIFARTCMMSRLKYKGSRIEWAVDECAQSLDYMPISHRRHVAIPTAPAKWPENSKTNRFQLLHMDD